MLCAVFVCCFDICSRQLNNSKKERSKLKQKRLEYLSSLHVIKHENYIMWNNKFEIMNVIVAT
jgi:hypothetical protein